VNECLGLWLERLIAEEDAALVLNGDLLV